MASNSGWSKSVPSGSSSIAQGDDDIRSFKSFVQAWLEQEHYVTDGSATSAGVLKPGAARAFVGPASQLSNPTGDNAGRFFFNTANESLYVANASTSSWSVIADAIRLDSNNSWTGNNEFSTNLKVTGIFSAITSISTRVTAAIGVAAAASGNTQFPNVSGFTRGDMLLASTESIFGGEIDRYMVRATFDNNFPTADLITFVIDNQNGASRVTIPSGTTIRVLGFKTFGF